MSSPIERHIELDELMQIMNDPDELKKYSFKPEQMPHAYIKDIFQMTVPYDEIRKIVQKVKDEFFNNLGPQGNQEFKHVGSTAIRGMPGSCKPDALLLEDTFPASRATVKALLDSGFYFQALLPHNDLWFVKSLDNYPIKESSTAPLKLNLHVMTPDNIMAKLLVLTRDLCNSDKSAFEEYKRCKLEAAAGDETTLEEYELKKKQCRFFSILQDQLSALPNIPNVCVRKTSLH